MTVVSPREEWQEIVREVFESPLTVNDTTSAGYDSAKTPSYCDLSQEIKSAIRQLRASLAQANYQFEDQPATEESVKITPLVGLE